MDSATRKEISSIASELQSIIDELGDIADGVEDEFKNVGNDRCSQAIERVRDRYINVRNDVNKVLGGVEWLE